MESDCHSRIFISAQSIIKIIIKSNWYLLSYEEKIVYITNKILCFYTWLSFFVFCTTSFFLFAWLKCTFTAATAFRHWQWQGHIESEEDTCSLALFFFQNYTSIYVFFFQKIYWIHLTLQKNIYIILPKYSCIFPPRFFISK